MNLFTCNSCGYLAFNKAPQQCPVCQAQQDQFKQNDSVFKEALEKSQEGAVKHIPVVIVKKDDSLISENKSTEVIARIGETLHPMTEEHFIQFVDCYVDNQFTARAQFSPRSNPAAIFLLKEGGENVQLVEFCNKHGYWQKEMSL